MAIRQGTLYLAPQRLDGIRVHARPHQPLEPRRRARNAAALPRSEDCCAAVEPAGARPPDARLGRNERTPEHRRLRQDALRARVRQKDRRSSRGRCEGPRRAARASRARVAFAERRYHCADHRRLQTQPPRRCGGGPVAEANGGGDRQARSALRPAPDCGFSIKKVWVSNKEFIMNWLITGVSSGFGRALSELILEKGGEVAGTVRKDADKAEFEKLAPGRA